jgi:hypothetical protein
MKRVRMLGRRLGFRREAALAEKGSSPTTLMITKIPSLNKRLTKPKKLKPRLKDFPQIT